MTAVNTEDHGRRQRGYDNAVALGGEETVRRFRAALADVSPMLADYVAEFIYGDLHGRPDLSTRDRQLVTLVALATLGGCEAQLRLHVGLALRAGLTPTEVVEAFLHLSAYAGFPRAINATLVAGGVLAANIDARCPDTSADATDAR